MTILPIIKRMNDSHSNNYKEKNNHDSSGCFSDDLSFLTNSQKTLIESIKRDYLPNVLQDQGLLEDKAIFIRNDIDREIHQIEFILKHYDRLQKMELNILKLRQSYKDEINSSRKRILNEHLLAFQFYLSAYYFALTDKLKNNTHYRVTS